MKWVNLLWSLVIVASFTIFCIWINPRTTGPLGAGFSFAVLASAACILISPVILLTRITRITKNADGFVYIFMGTANLAIGILGVYAEVRSRTPFDFQVIACLTINLLFGGFAFVDTFVKTIPGYRRKDA
jgi:hypothetical protein